MRYEELRHHDDAAFRRFCGVPRATFEAMLEVVEQGEREKSKPGRPPKLSVADQVLLTLSYWREYRTLFHLAAEVGLHESSVQRIVCKVEDRLIGSGRFALPSRERRRGEGAEIEAVLLDATESPIERPKKNSARTTAGRRSGTRERARCSSSPVAA